MIVRLERLRTYCWISVFIASVLLMNGCRQRNKDETPDKQAPKDRISAAPMRVLPASSGASRSYAKIGHWAQTRQSIAANIGNESIVLNYRPATSANDPQANTVFTRTIAIARGQRKSVEQSIFLPDRMNTLVDANRGFRNSVQVGIELKDRSLGNQLGVQSEQVSLLQEYQTKLVILANNVDTQKFWFQSSVVKWPRGFNSFTSIQPFVCIPINRQDLRDSFPSNFHGLSSTSTIYWNDIPADDLSREQQIALLDWLHYGGRLIVNGPNTIAGLANSFLEPYLPLTKLKNSDQELERVVASLNSFSLRVADDTYDYSSQLINPLSESRNDALFSDPYSQDEASLNPTAPTNNEPANSAQSTTPQKTAIVSREAIAGSICTAELRPTSRWVPECEGLLAERRVGSGRICMSTFDLSGEVLTKWTSYGNFLHTAVFRLPPRRWQHNVDDQAYTFADQLQYSERSLFNYSSLTRIANMMPIEQRLDQPELPRPDAIPLDILAARGGGAMSSPSDAGWHDNTYFSRLALSSLQDTSGIKVPPVGYLTRILGVYLLVLVPINWIVFRLLRRLEWAWFSIPVIAISGATVIAHLLQIEIGFARSQNSIALLEIKNGYERAALTRYSSLYTSLSSLFSLSIPENRGYVLPVVGDTHRQLENTNLIYRSLDDAGSGLRGLPIRSHTSSIFHSDEVVDLKGTVSVLSLKDTASRSLLNKTSFNLRDLVRVQRVNGRTKYFWVGSLAKGEQLELNDSQSLDLGEVSSTLRERLQSLSMPESDQPQGDLLQWKRRREAISEAIVNLVSAVSNGVDCDIAVGWTESSLSTLVVQPVPSQQDEHTLVCWTLAEPDWRPLAKDYSLPPENLIQYNDEINLSDYAE